MQNSKKATAIALIAILLIIVSSSMFGCANHLEDEVVIGDFVCQVRSNGTVNLKNLSEEGKKKKYIVVPQELNGMRVEMLGYRNAVFSTGRSNWQSENLEKIYINSEFAFFLDGIFDNCPNLKKYVLIKKHYKDRADFLNLLITTYFTPKYYFDEWGGDDNLRYFSDGRLRWRGADVSYYYNHEESPNNGYYWIDDVEDGELIEYIPEEPIREGYRFEGWYKEEECINKWDFEKDTIIKADADEPYYENKLFAEWAKE